MSPVPGGAVPLRVKGLYLSKFVMRSGGTSSRSPPFGAFGLTHSKCGNPAGYLMSPNCEYACAAQAGLAEKAATKTMLLAIDLMLVDGRHRREQFPRIGM